MSGKGRDVYWADKEKRTSKIQKKRREARTDPLKIRSGGQGGGRESGEAGRRIRLKATLIIAPHVAHLTALMDTPGRPQECCELWHREGVASRGGGGGGKPGNSLKLVPTLLLI